VWRIKRSGKGRERIGEGGSVENKEEWDREGEERIGEGGSVENKEE
jgi:hypothetical protein